MKRKQFIKKGILSGTAMIAGMGMVSSCTKKEESKIESVNFNFNKSYNFRMVSVWPKNFPIFGEADHLFMDSIEKMSGNRIKFKLFSKGELVPAYESFDAVQDGTADVGAGVSYYWMGKAPASVFFSTVPFGMNAQRIQTGAKASEQFKNAEVVRESNFSTLPSFIKFRKSDQFDIDMLKAWMKSSFKFDPNISFIEIRKDIDNLGHIHYRYQQTYYG